MTNDADPVLKFRLGTLLLSDEMIIESVDESFMMLVVSVVPSKESEKASFNDKSIGLCFIEGRIMLLSDDIS